MKQVVFMILVTLVGTVGAFVVRPFLGVAVYYLFAVLRPQYLWQWSLPPDVAWSFYVALATLLAAAAGLVSGRLPFNRAHLAVLGFGVWIGFCSWNAHDPTVSYPWFLEYAKIFLMFAASAVLIGSVRDLGMLLVLAALALAYIAYEVNFLYLSCGYLGIFHNGYGGLDNNGAGLMLAMGIPLCYFAWEGSRGRWRWGFLALIPVLLHAVLMTYSRGAMVSLLAAMPLVWLRSRNRAWLSSIAVVVLVLLPFLAGQEIRERFFSTGQYQQDDSAQSRFASWTAAWKMTLDHPVFGVGVRNSNLFSQQYGADMEGRTIHNTYLQTAADTGFVGLGLYLLALTMAWHALREGRHAVAGRTDPEADRVRVIAAAAECSFAVFAVGGTFLSLEVFELPFLLLLVGAQLPGVIAPVPQPVRELRPNRPVLRPASAV